MRELDDSALLREYVERDSEEAFAALVTRHVNKVYSVALRLTGNPHSAEEITQAVFVILAKKSRQLGKRVILSGWLYQTARLTAVTFIRGGIRRARREQEACMQTALNENESDLSRRSDTEADAIWKQFAPLLDAAMAGLNEADRHAVVLRFFDGKSLREVGAALGANEDAAKKRVSRAVEKLRAFFASRGVTLTATVIAGAVAANSVQAAPAGLAATVTTTAAKGTLISATITTLVKGTMKTMTWIKLKFAAGVGMAALLAGGVATVAISQTGGDDKPTAQEIAGKSRDAYVALSSYSDSGTVVSEIAGQNITLAFNTRLQRPNLYRIDWTQGTGLKGVVWSGGSGDYLQIDPGSPATPGALAALTAARQKNNPNPQKMPNMKTALALATGLSYSAASTIPGLFFNQDLGDLFFAPAASGRYPLQKKEDAKVGDVDCYVVSGVMDLSKQPDKGKPGTATTVLWIGKSDFLVHQCRTTYVEKVDSSVASDEAIDEAIKKSLEMQNKPVTPEAVAAMRPQMKVIMKQVQATLKTGFAAGIVFTQTHENISVNQKFLPSDFDR